jgi:pimeloyl-ACP methyl ester carboxylesterase
MITRKWVIGIGGVLAILVVGAIWLLTSLVLYYSPAKQRLTSAQFDKLAAAAPGEIQKVKIKANDGVGTVAWYLPAAGPRQSPRYGVVMTHGGGDDKRFYLPLAERLQREGFAVILPDLRGHGESERSPGGLTLGISEGRDVAAAAEFLVHHDAVSVAAVGVSMGGAATVVGAAQNPHIGPLVLESTTYDARRVFDTLGGVLGLRPGLLRNGFANTLTFVGLLRMGASWADAWSGSLPTLRLAHQLSPRSTLFVFGDKDSLILAPAVEHYSKAFRGNTRIVEFPSVGHGVYPKRPAQYTALVTDFVTRWRDSANAPITAPSVRPDPVRR